MREARYILCVRRMTLVVQVVLGTGCPLTGHQVFVVLLVFVVSLEGDYKVERLLGQITHRPSCPLR